MVQIDDYIMMKELWFDDELHTQINNISSCDESLEVTEEMFGGISELSEIHIIAELTQIESFARHIE